MTTHKPIDLHKLTKAQLIRRLKAVLRGKDRRVRPLEVTLHRCQNRYGHPSYGVDIHMPEGTVYKLRDATVLEVCHA